MCAPVLPLLGAIGGVVTAASSLGILGMGQKQGQAPQRNQTPPPSAQNPGPQAAGAGDDEQIKAEDIEVKQNAKQKRDKQTTKKGTGGLGAKDPGVNTGTSPDTPAGGVNTGTDPTT
tara:strand:- start:279 stop:629 length:351 start_codon:yes stop_codon:yes gene_type:complete